MESTFSATFWWTLWIYICCKIKSAKRAVFVVLGDAEVNEEELKRESSFGSKVCWIRDLWQLWVTTLTATASWLQTTFRSDGWGAILNRRVWTPSHLTSESAGEEFKSSQDTCANNGWKNSYHRSDQDREGTSVMTICAFEMLSLLLTPVQWGDSGMLGASNRHTLALMAFCEWWTCTG